MLETTARAEGPGGGTCSQEARPGVGQGRSPDRTPGSGYQQAPHPPLRGGSKKQNEGLQGLKIPGDRDRTIIAKAGPWASLWWISAHAGGVGAKGSKAGSAAGNFDLCIQCPHLCRGIDVFMVNVLKEEKLRFRKRGQVAEGQMRSQEVLSRSTLCKAPGYPSFLWKVNSDN